MTHKFQTNNNEVYLINMNSPLSFLAMRSQGSPRKTNNCKTAVNVIFSVVSLLCFPYLLKRGSIHMCYWLHLTGSNSYYWSKNRKHGTWRIILSLIKAKVQFKIDVNWLKEKQDDRKVFITCHLPFWEDHVLKILATLLDRRDQSLLWWEKSSGLKSSQGLLWMNSYNSLKWSEILPRICSRRRKREPISRVFWHSQNIRRLYCRHRNVYLNWVWFCKGN